MSHFSQNSSSVLSTWQIEKYLSSNDLLPSTQSGFRRGHSTETVVLKVYNDAVIASDKGEVTCLLLLDYSAAFDTVDHNILLTILEESFGITGSVLAWIRSFLTDRHQIFQVGPGQITHGGRPLRPSAGHDPRPTNVYSLHSRFREYPRETWGEDAPIRWRHSSLTDEQPRTGHGEIWGMSGGHSSVEQSASAQTQSHKDRTHMAGSCPRYRKTTPATSSSNELERSDQLLISPSPGRDYRFWINPSDSCLHSGKKLFLPTSKNPTS